MAAIVLLVLKASIILSVFAIGLKASFRDVTYLFRWPGQLLRAFLSMGIIMPLVALLLVLQFDLHPAVQIALVTISVSPIPPIFPNKALKAGGRENYTIGLLVASAAFSVIVIPLAMKVFERIVDTPLRMPPSTVAATVATTIFLPRFWCAPVDCADGFPTARGWSASGRRSPCGWSAGRKCRRRPAPGNTIRRA